MSVNAGDIDNDGDLDLHLGTGWMNLSGLVPDLTYANVGGRFEDVYHESTGTGTSEGHGVSFADWDDDGDLDLFVVLGGGCPRSGLTPCSRTRARALAEGQTHRDQDEPVCGRRSSCESTWRAPDGSRSIHRVIGNNGSFGVTLVESIGLSTRNPPTA
jgi:hypothetical protein